MIYRRLDFGINISDVHDERSSVKVVEASVPTRKSKISDVLCSEEDSNSAFPRRESRENPWVVGGGGGVLPCKRLMGMCRLIGSHFHDWIDYNGVAFSIGFLELGRAFSDFLE